MFTARTAAIEHLSRGHVVDGPADGALAVDMIISEGRELFPGLLVWQRVAHDGLLGDFRQGDVAGDVLQIGPVVLPHHEKLPTVSKNCRTNPALLEAGVLLHDGDVPGVELPHLRVALSHDLLAFRNI